MRYFVKKLSREGVTLSCYLHDVSPELSNADLRPAMVVFPGGGYFMCSDREAEPIALAYMAEGYQAFVLRYTVGQNIPFEPALEDAKEALAYIRQNGAELCVNTDKIAVSGFSAGGHLAACMGTMADPRPSAMVLGYPVILGEFGKDVKKNLPNIPDFVDKTTSPAYIFTTCTDELVPVRNSFALASKLDAYHVPFEFHVFPEGPHGLSLAKAVTSGGKPGMVEPEVQGWFRESCEFLTKIWGDFECNNNAPGLGMKIDELGINTPLKNLMEDPRCREIILSVMPQVEAMLEQAPSAGMYSLTVMNHFSPEIMTDELLETFRQKLEG